MTTKAKIGESLIDLGTRIYGHASGVLWLLEDNENFGLNTEFSTEAEVIIRDGKVKLLEVGQVNFKKQKLAKYPLLNHQSIFDVAIENQGSVEGVFSLTEANRFDGITEHIFVDQELEILEEAIAPRLRDSLKKNMPITTINEEDKADGIGYMFITKNFLIR